MDFIHRASVHLYDFISWPLPGVLPIDNLTNDIGFRIEGGYAWNVNHSMNNLKAGLGSGIR